MKRKVTSILFLVNILFNLHLWGQIVDTEYLRGMDEIYVSSVMKPQEIALSFFSSGLTNRRISEIIVQKLRANGINAKVARSVYNTPLLRARTSYNNDYGMMTFDMTIHGNIGSKRAVLWYASPTADFDDNRSQAQLISKIIEHVRLQTQWLIDDWRKEH